MKEEFIALFAALFVLFFLSAASPQTYNITETQLQKLETICQTYKANNQKLMEQLNESKQESVLLKEQLQKERDSTKSLNESLLKFENNAAQSEADKVQALIDLEEQKTKNAKQQTVIVILSSILGGLVLIAGTVIVMRILKK